MLSITRSMALGQNGERREGSLIFSGCGYFHWRRLATLFQEAFPFLSLNELSFVLRNSKENTRLCFAGKDLVGFYSYQPGKAPGVVWLNFIAVRRDYRNSGIGKGLLEKLDEEVSQKGFSRIELAVYKGNSTAIRLYERCGYTRLPRAGEKWTYYKEIRPRPTAGRDKGEPSRGLFHILRKSSRWLAYRILVLF